MEEQQAWASNTREELSGCSSSQPQAREAGSSPILQQMHRQGGRFPQEALASLPALPKSQAVLQ